VKVSVVATVKDAGPVIGQFLESLRRQTRTPEEIVIIDGGSTDGTLERLQRAQGIVTISEPGANIARGRNLAIQGATHEVLAVTDADCILAPSWLERILEPIEQGEEVVAGFYRPLPANLFETWTVAHIPDAEEVGPEWMPSSRSLAFRREAFEAVGGYPEWLAIGEDMYLNQRWRRVGIRIRPATDAVVYWRPRPGPRATWRQYVRYAEGDALAGMYPERHALRFLAYGAVVLAFRFRRPWMVVALSTAAGVHAARPFARTWGRAPRPSARVLSLIGLPLTMALIDAAKMWGYAKGLATRLGGAPPA
jgi:glycosyltransferase involved in cell wall biosynthesis